MKQFLPDLVGQLSNSLGNSLMAVSSLLSRTRDNGGDEARILRQTMELLERNVERSINLVQSFTALADTEGRRDQTDLVLPDIIDQARLSVADAMQEARVDVLKDMVADLRVRANRQRLVGLFEILFDNSLRHGFPSLVPEIKPRRIRISAGQGYEGLVIRFCDNGRGVEPSALEQLFDPFRSKNRQGAFAGLGLSIAYAVVVGDLGGTIRGEPAPGGGLCISMTLPQTGAEAHT